MLYIADLHRDGLLKVGVTAWTRENARRSELRRTLGAPGLEFIVTTPVPFGWGTETEWERRLLAALRARSGRLQLFSDAELSEEVVDATPSDAYGELSRMRARTEIDANLSAKLLPPDKEDWRFVNFMERVYPKARYSPADFPSQWKDLINRQLFLYWLRDEPIEKSRRLSLGYSCAEIDRLQDSRQAAL
jgi:hypothetical protein